MKNENKYRYKQENEIVDCESIQEILELVAEEYASDKARIYTVEYIYSKLAEEYCRTKKKNDFKEVKVDRRTKMYRILINVKDYTKEEIAKLVHVCSTQYASSHAVGKSRSTGLSHSFYPTVFVLRDNEKNFFFAVSYDKCQ